MKRFLFALFLLPLFANAQVEHTLKEDFRENIQELGKTFAWDDKINILPVNSERGNSEIIALDENMNTVWSAPVAGYVLQCGKFKDNLLVVCVDKLSMFGGLKGGFQAYIINAKTGKVNLQKELISPPSKNYQQFTLLFNKMGSTFSIAFRETNLSPGIKIFPGMKNYFKTKSLSIISYNEVLEPRVMLNPDVTDQVLLSVDTNNWGDIFLSVLKNNNTVEVSRYITGNSTVTGTVSQVIELNKHVKAETASLHFSFLPSKQSADVLYFAVMHVNYEKDVQLSTVKIDFGHNSATVAKEIFNKDHIKQIEKAFIKKKGIDKPDIGTGINMEVRNMEEYNGGLIMAISARTLVSGTYTSWFVEASHVINIYDQDLKLKFRQLMPADYKSPLKFFSKGFNVSGKYLYFICNHKDGMIKFGTLYGQLDLATGQWLKLEKLSKDKIKGTTVVEGDAILWFNNGFITPYLHKNLIGLKYDVDIQKNAY